MQTVEYNDWNFQTYTGSITKPSQVSSLGVSYNKHFVHIQGTLELSKTTTLLDLEITLPQELDCYIMTAPFLTANTGGSYGVVRYNRQSFRLTQTRQGSTTVPTAYFGILARRV